MPLQHVTPPRLHQHPAHRYQGRAENEEPDVPADRRSEVVAHMMDSEDVMVDYPFDQVEEAPADHQPSEMQSPRRGQLATLPCAGRGDRPRENGDPHRGVKEPIGEGVVFQPDNGAGRAAAFIREHVVPLEDLVKQDSIDKTPETDAHQKRWQQRRGGSR